MKEKINIAKILKDKPRGTKLYSSACGKCKLEEVDDKSFKISFYNSKFGFMNGGEGYLDKNGKLYDDGECVVFPSKEMRDWEKFAWKRGDVLVNSRGLKILFDRWANDNYTSFYAKTINLVEDGFLDTNLHTLASEKEAKSFIKCIEEKLGGKLNRETLEVEKPKKKPVFELGNLYVFNEEDEDGEQTIIGKLIGKNESEDTLTFGNQYEIENEKFVTDQAFDLRISIHEELREATEGEAITFQEAYTIWEKSKEQPVFKPFDKVLCRDDIGKEWNIDLFESTVTHNSKYNYKCMANIWKFCIPYAGNENLLGTTKDVEV